MRALPIGLVFGTLCAMSWAASEVTFEKGTVYLAEKGGGEVKILRVGDASIETIMKRTIDYHQRGIYVLWLLPWTANLDNERYAPALWEKWIHACYFGRVYYWLQELEVAEYRFEPSFQIVPKTTWYAEGGRKMTAGGYATRSVRFRAPRRGDTLNIARDFGPRKRLWWEGGGVKVPDARLFMRGKCGLKGI